MNIIKKMQNDLFKDNRKVQVRPLKNKWIFDIIDLSSNIKDLNFNFIWGKNFPVNYVDIDGKIEKLKEYETEEEAFKVGICYYNFIKEVLPNSRFSILI